MAFPVNSTLIDDFNRADQSPPGGPWDAGTVLGFGFGLSVSNNRLTGGGASKLTASYGPDVDFSFTWAQSGPNTTLYVRLSNTTASYTGYRIDLFSGNEIVRLFKVVSGSPTQIGSNVNYINVSAGEKIGVEVRGGVFTVYRNTGSGWTQIAQWTDGSPINTSGGAVAVSGIGFGSIDDFTGGDAVTTVTHLGAASLSGESDLSASGTVIPPPIEGSASLSGESALTAAGVTFKIAQGAASLSAESTFTAAATVAHVHEGAATLAGNSTFAALGGLVLTATASFAGNTTLVAGALRTAGATAALSGQTTLTVSTIGIVQAAAALAGNSGLSGTAGLISIGAGAFSAQSNMSADGGRVTAAAAILASEGIVTAEWDAGIYAAALLTGESSFAADANRVAIAIALISGESNLIAQARSGIPKYPVSPHTIPAGQIGDITGGHLLQPIPGRILMPVTGRIEQED